MVDPNTVGVLVLPAIHVTWNVEAAAMVTEQSGALHRTVDDGCSAYMGPRQPNRTSATRSVVVYLTRNFWARVNGNRDVRQMRVDADGAVLPIFSHTSEPPSSQPRNASMSLPANELVDDVAPKYDSDDSGTGAGNENVMYVGLLLPDVTNVDGSSSRRRAVRTAVDSTRSVP